MAPDTCTAIDIPLYLTSGGNWAEDRLPSGPYRQAYTSPIAMIMAVSIDATLKLPSMEKNREENSNMPTEPAMNTHLKLRRSPRTPNRGMVNSATDAPQIVASSMTIRSIPRVLVA